MLEHQFKQWLRDQYPKLPDEEKPLECMQRAGDVLFVPNLFAHGTYTVQESVGVAVEFNSWLGDTPTKADQQLIEAESL